MLSFILLEHHVVTAGESQLRLATWTQAQSKLIEAKLIPEGPSKQSWVFFFFPFPSLLRAEKSFIEPIAICLPEGSANKAHGFL